MIAAKRRRSRAHDHREGARCSPACPTDQARLDPIAVRWAVIVAVALVLVWVAPFSIVQRLAPLLSVVGLFGLAVGLLMAAFVCGRHVAQHLRKD